MNNSIHKQIEYQLWNMVNNCITNHLTIKIPRGYCRLAIQKIYQPVECQIHHVTDHVYYKSLKIAVK